MYEIKHQLIFLKLQASCFRSAYKNIPHLICDVCITVINSNTQLHLFLGNLFQSVLFMYLLVREEPSCMTYYVFIMYWVFFNFSITRFLTLVYSFWIIFDIVTYWFFSNHYFSDSQRSPFELHWIMA